MDTILVALSAKESAQAESSARNNITGRHPNLGSSTFSKELQRLQWYGCAASIIIVEGSEELIEEPLKMDNKENRLSTENVSIGEKRSITLGH